ncbi:MAG: aldo/keto reductase, partial [Bacteroidetes bacterium]|nr:aldo/keto reductase [Bacteroidota bacterium]
DIPDESVRSKIERFQSRASEARVSLPEYALRFILSHDAVSSVIVGTKRSDHLMANTAASQKIELTKSIGLNERPRVTGN